MHNSEEVIPVAADEEYVCVSTKPERNLLAAMMARAICDAFGDAHCERHHTSTARHWLFAKIKPKRPYSFGWVAIHLDLDPFELQDLIRYRLERGEMPDMIATLQA